jgi:hypothetical protein
MFEQSNCELLAITLKTLQELINTFVRGIISDIKLVNIFSIIIVVVAIGLFGGIIYLIYLPFKKQLIKSGKLTDKLNRQINLFFILLLFLFGGVLYCFKNYRTSSKDRLEEISNISLPSHFIVLKDEYQDMLPHYCMLYIAQFHINSSKELISNIRKSKYFNLNSFYKGAWKENDFIMVDSVKAVWSKSAKGYDFSSQNGLTYYSIEFDTMTNILEYNECSD